MNINDTLEKITDQLFTAQKSNEYFMRKGMEMAFRHCLNLTQATGITIEEMARNINEMIEKSQNKNG